MTRLVRLLTLVFLLTGMGGAQALAHASLISSTPSDGEVVSAAPPMFVLRFNEPVAVTRIRLTAADGAQRDLAFKARDERIEVTLPPELPSGSQVISYRIVSADGHPVAGSVIFSVGATTRVASPDSSSSRALMAAIWITRCLVYTGLFGAIGGVFFLTWVADEQPARIIRSLRILATVGAAALLFSLGLQGADLRGDGWSGLLKSEVWRAGAMTSLGASVLAGLFALSMAVVAMRVAATTASRLASALALAGVGLAFALTGHASSADPRWLMRPAVFAHAVGVTFWMGSLYPLAALVRNKGVASLASVRRFSNWAVAFVAVLVLAGIAISVVQLGGWAMVATGYGKLWIAKMLLVGALLALAALNRAYLTPRMAGDVGGAGKLVKAITLEMLLALAIFGIVAGWRFTPPPRTIAVAAPSAVHVHLHGKRAMADLEIRRGVAGRTSLQAIVSSTDDRPLKPKEVTMQLRNDGAGIEPIERKAALGSDGDWRVGDLSLPIAGRWTVRLDILIDDFEQESLEADAQIDP